MKIPFDIKFRPQIESGEYKVVNRFDHPVTILTFEKPGNYPIVCYQSNIPEPDVFCANLCGEVDTRPFGVSTHADLFIIIPEPELSDFEKAVGLEIFDEPFSERNIKVIKEESAKLLALARKELSKQIVDHTKEAYENGKSEALKDLPRWKKDGSFETEGSFMGVKGRELFVVKDGYSISVSELIKKLPGFKEDWT